LAPTSGARNSASILEQKIDIAQARSGYLGFSATELVKIADGLDHAVLI
jgi:hypothetical protein